MVLYFLGGGGGGNWIIFFGLGGGKLPSPLD